MVAPYSPPFAITPAIVSLIAAIAERVGHYALASDSAAALRLRRINRIRTIQGSLAIEGNTLSEQQITAILEGKRVIAPPREVQEVRNALLSPHEGTSTPFIGFMLGVIRAALAAHPTEQATVQATEQVRRLPALMGDGCYSARSLMGLLGLSHRPTFLYDYLQPALAAGWLEQTHPDTPKSPRQQYRLTRAGQRLAQELTQDIQ